MEELVSISDIEAGRVHDGTMCTDSNVTYEVIDSLGLWYKGGSNKAWKEIDSIHNLCTGILHDVK